MTPMHRAVVGLVRQIILRPDNKTDATLIPLDDEKLARVLFANYRPLGGLRLTRLGLEIMEGSFKPYVIPLPKDRAPPSSGAILYLDRRATLPYYLGHEKLVVFESGLGIKLKLADGDIQTLIEMEGIS